ncbi:hypothetical protein M409DRAFT_30556 [Zasmidium cellare ATCC 36951]|uniref:Enoyl reductase (ER) domain-containing protein n=1 Tax=Zasmidium cellare ATCC 36951 TaxID=1080233 RepID=A0A6A6BW42_ZASCE|nr:uncharacterized protein M409DRAFT_30556 [Zasmidium cellare ATCC 36951]KAF2159021.1 hypothetical protein M409DRAFT_30556 [Zasmidium cellare ATCC 36951]
MPTQAIISPSLEVVHFIDTPIPTPAEQELVIKVIVSGSNPKDWKYPLWKNKAFNSGDNIAGVVHSIGSKVYEFKPGDRVAAYHEPQKDNGSFAEYAVAYDWVSFHIPNDVSFEEAATMPVAAITAGLGIWADLDISPPWHINASANAQKPLVIYGITSAVGAFAAKMARLSGVKRIIGIAGRNAEFAGTLADFVVDYRLGEDALVDRIEEILTTEGFGSKAPLVFDAISEGGTVETALRFVNHSGGVVSTVLPPTLFAQDPKSFEYPTSVTAINTASPFVLWHRKDFGYVLCRNFGRLLADGRLNAHPFEIIPGGLHGVLEGLRELKRGENSGLKYVFRIEETGPVQYSEPPQLSASTHRLRNFPFPA